MAPVAVRWVAALGMGMLLAACSPSADRRDVPAGTDRVVELSISGMDFVPNHIEVKTGEVVAFVVTNPTDIAHELFIGDEADQLAHHAAHMAVASPDQALVQHYGYGFYLAPHATEVLSYNFDSSLEIMLGCHLPGHWEAGMVATVTVVP